MTERLGCPYEGCDGLLKQEVGATKQAVAHSPVDMAVVSELWKCDGCHQFFKRDWHWELYELPKEKDDGSS